jgi:hypothetical protein
MRIAARFLLGVGCSVFLIANEAGFEIDSRLRPLRVMGTLRTAAGNQPARDLDREHAQFEVVRPLQ